MEKKKTKKQNEIPTGKEDLRFRNGLDYNYFMMLQPSDLVCG